MGRWYPAVVALLVTSLVVSNIIAVRLIAIRLSDSIELTLPAAIVLFPIAYIVGDVLTEVYGYAAARRAVRIAVGGHIVAGLAIHIAGGVPGAA
ncbi:MAG: VUT family protein, partial [Chloroflexi bacterium]|nr:VUT family protein [Chloroflexota bacterium]